MQTKPTTNHPASHYGIPVAVDRHGNAYSPLDLAIQDATLVTGWAVVEEHGELVVRATGNGLAQVFARPNYVQEYAAWCRYLRTHGYGVSQKYPRGFAYEFDLCVGPAAEAEYTGREAARLLTSPYGGRPWYGTIMRQAEQEDRE